MSDSVSTRYKDALRRGHVAVVRGRPREAISHYEQAGELVPDRPLPFVSMGNVYLQMREPKEALEAFDEALERAPSDVAAMRGRAAALEAAGKGLEAGVGHLIHIADSAVGNRANTAERFVHIAVHLTPERADHPRFVEILYDNDLRPVDRGDVLAVLLPRIGIVLPVVRIAGADNHADRSADHWPHPRHEVAGFLDIEPDRRDIVSGDLLPAVVYGRRVPAFQFEHLVVFDHDRLSFREGSSRFKV